MKEDTEQPTIIQRTFTQHLTIIQRTPIEHLSKAQQSKDSTTAYLAYICCGCAEYRRSRARRSQRWIWDGFGVDPGCIWGESGVDLGGSGVDLEWIWVDLE